MPPRRQQTPQAPSQTHLTLPRAVLLAANVQILLAADRRGFHRNLNATAVAPRRDFPPRTPAGAPAGAAERGRDALALHWL